MDNESVTNLNEGKKPSAASENTASTTPKSKIVTHCDIPMGIEITCLFSSGTKMPLTLVGFEENDFLLFRFPLITNVQSYLAPNTSISSVFQHDGFNIFFKSSIKWALPKQRLAFFQYPQNFRMYEVRQTERVSCLIVAAITLDKQYLGVMNDISLTGCKVTFDAIHGTPLRHLEKGQKLAWNVYTPTETLHIEGTILRIAKSFTRITLGVAFENTSKQGKKILSEFIGSLKFSGIEIEE